MAHRAADVSAALQGRYTLERELGRGGMATVYLARDLRHDRTIALKVLDPDLARTLGPLRFQREIQLTSRLDHPSVLPVLDSGAAAEQCWYVMPYVEGGSLRARLQRERQLGIPEAVRIARDVAGALEHAHRRGIVHRDIKPENILLSGDRVLVADFGIAKLLEADGAQKLTETGLSLGTPAYMSPEQAAGEARLDGRADVYALGCVLYEMLVGTPPFSGPSAQAIMARHAIDPVPSVRTVRGTVPPALEAVITTALAKIPADRFETAGELAAALAPEALAAAASNAANSGAITRAALPGHAARRRWWTGAVLLAVAVLTVSGLAAWALLRARGPLVAPSASVMAVLPFTPAGDDTALARLGRDLAGTVSANLDGVGDIRVVDRLTILAQTNDQDGPLPLAEAAALGRRYGATSVVVGSLSRAGGKVRVDVGLYASDSLTPLAQAVVTGSPDSLGALTDSVTWRVLNVVWRRGTPPTPTLQAITTRSVEALRAYLDGEQASVAGRIEDAKAAYARAIAADSTFWYAYFRAANAAGWQEGDADSATVQAYLSHRALLPRRERLLIEATQLDSGLIAKRARLEALVQEFPDYWPAWWMLADGLVHGYPYVGSSRAEARRALERVVALNPRMVFPWAHLVWMYQAARDTAAAARALDVLDRLDARRTLLEYGRDDMLLWRAIEAFQTGDSSSASLLDSLYRFAIGPSAFGESWVLSFALSTASPAVQIEFNRRVLHHGLPPDETADYLRSTSLMWAARGAWDSALATVDEIEGTYPEDPTPLLAYRLAVLGTWLGGLPPGGAQARRAAAAKAIAESPTELVAPFQADLAWLDGIDAVVRKDQAALASAQAAVRAANDTFPLRASLVDLGPFALALRGNRSEAARRLAALEWKAADRNPWLAAVTHPLRRAINRMAAAQWLLEAGDTAQAERLLAYTQAFSGPFLEKFPVRPLFDLQLARIAEARGRSDDARRLYQRFLVSYDLPSPRHRHLVAEARTALARLAGATGVSQDR